MIPSVRAPSRRRSRPRLVLLALVTAVACSSSDKAAGPELAGTGASGNSSLTGDGGPGGDGDGDGDTGDEGPYLDVADPDDDPVCDVWAQDCPPEHKCTWELVDGAPHTVCVPVPADAKAPGETCTMFGGPGTGHDDCELGAMCSWLDDRGAGICLALCGGSPAEPSCEGAGLPALCQPCNACPSLCLPTCDPLADACGPGYACTPNADDFTCLPADQLGDGGLGDPCEYAIQCQAGMACIEAAQVPSCDGAGCCSPFCSLEQPACPNAMVCVPWFNGLDIPPLPDLGVCVAG